MIFLFQSIFPFVDVDRVVVVVVLLELCGLVEFLVVRVVIVGVSGDFVVIGIGYGLIKTNIK
jgi:hypothetical protein